MRLKKLRPLYWYCYFQTLLWALEDWAEQYAPEA